MKKQVITSSTKKRSFIKACTWEITAFFITLIAVYFVYGNIKASLKFALILTVVKIVFLYLHERSWKKVSWGKITFKKP